ncbi:HNH endonuclease [Mycolicibacterium rhodesiae JS60]|nr:HNH endonuclease [Mycolicibacterium rhodesiae JS60]
MPADDDSASFDGAGLLEQLARDALLAEAEDLARGVRHVSVATGDPETDHDVALVNAFTNAVWSARGDTRATSIRGGNDYMTVRIEGPDAAAFVDELAALAEDLNPGFWRITRSPHPF